MRRLLLGTIALSILASAWYGCGGLRLDLLDPARPLGPRPSHFGLSLPVPVTASMRLPVDTVRTGLAERRIPTILQVDQKGRVGAVSFDSSADGLLAGKYVPYLKSLRFEPGMKEGLPSDFRLRIELQVGAGKPPLLHFPVGPNREITRSEVFWAAMRTAGVAPARLVEFPSFYYIPSSAVTGDLYDYKTYRVELDSMGAVTGIAPVSATIQSFTDQIATAAVWARYEPMRIDGRAVSSSSYLAVALFSEADYPTTRWLAESESLPTDKERLRVRLLPDTLGEMFPPVVKREWSGPIIDSAVWEPHSELISTRVVIDTTGVASLRESSLNSWRFRRMLIGRAFDRGFYPARSFSGSLIPWPGLACVRYLDSTFVKIWFDWAPVPDPKSAPADDVDAD
jgi:hypothetical protein